jgi:hypothetical protein
MALVFDPTADITTVLGEVGETLTHRTKSYTVDSMGRKTAEVVTDTSITGYIQAITESDTELISAGYIPGTDFVGVFLESDSVNEKDFILQGSREFIVTQIDTRGRIGGTDYATTCRLREVDG